MDFGDSGLPVSEKAGADLRRCRLIDRALLAATSLLFLAVSVEVIAVLGFILGCPISGWTLPLAALAGVAGTMLVARGSSQLRWRTNTAIGVSIAAVVFASSAGLSGLFHDTSYDGQWYHQPAVMALSKGWNPLRGQIAGDVAKAALLVGYSEKSDGDTAEIQINHFAKGPWYLAAAVVNAGARWEQAKAFNAVLAAAAALGAFAAFLSFTQWTPASAALVACLVAMNPVTTCQALTFYVDGQLGSILTLVVAMGVLSIQRRYVAAEAGFCAAVVLLVNVKFTGAVFAFVLALAACLLTAFTHGRRKAGRFATIAAAAIFMAALVGWEPYVSNTLSEGNPFYPMVGRGALNFTSFLPTGFSGMNRVEQLTWSLLSASSNGTWHQDDAGKFYDTISPRLKMPFSIAKKELLVFKAPDVRLGGFGPLFSGTLLLGVLVSLACLASRSLGAARIWVAWSFGLVALVISALLNPEAWWARLSPQVWLIPFVLLLAPVTTTTRVVSALKVSLIAMLAVNSGLVAYTNLDQSARRERRVRAELRELAAVPGGIELQIKYCEAVRFRLMAAGISFRVTTSLHCKEPHRVTSSDASWCPARL